MSKSDENLQKKFINLLKVYLENVNKMPSNITPEFEIKFGTLGVKPITQINQNNVIKKFLAQGFKLEGNVKNILRIQNQYVNKFGETKLSNIRTEITDIKNIQKYCKTERINDVDVEFVNKNYFASKTNKEPYFPINFNDFNFRITFQSEQLQGTNNKDVESTISKWENTKKVYRYISRHTFIRDDMPFRLDISVVKESKRSGKTLIPEYSIKESNVFNNNERYEIEIEIDNNKITDEFTDVNKLHNTLRQFIKQVLSGLQETKYPISYSEQKDITKKYLKLFKEKIYENQRVYPSDFIGPSSYTLLPVNISPVNIDSNIPNIRNNYTVTEKADGIRKLMYVSDDGKIYLITTAVTIQFTGARTNNKDLYNSLLDGEHIIHNKKKQFINLYAAFDIYYINGKDVRSLGFTPINKDEVLTKYRLPLLMNFTKNLDVKSINPKSLSPIRIEHKKFYAQTENQSIFEGCKFILTKMRDDLFEYETDGMIFTPSDTGVGTNIIGEKSKPYKVTWERSFKWKPPEFNTIDFLMSTKKNADGSEYIGNIFQSGINTSTIDQLTQYKTAILRVGFDEKKHGYMNPCENIIQDKIPDPDNIDDNNTYKPVQFFPTNPYDSEAGICNILLKEDITGNKKLFTKENEVIEDNMIVEFSYDLSKEKQWRWQPLRVRYDKTAELRSGIKNYGNAYHVADSNWHSIHNPISEDMLMTGENIPNELGDDDVYYNKVSGSTNTRGLRDFHNLYVKKALIDSVSKSGDSLIDYAVGKAGDLPKWIYSKLSFVFGMDLSKDNIENRLDGACARYLNYRKKFKIMPDTLFVHGNSSINIKNTEAAYNEKGKQIIKAVFGEGEKDVNKLGKGVYKHYGKSKEGFNVSSIQFAVHYMFENKQTLHNFLRNISECTKVGGYFIGTSYDGETVYNELKNTKEGEKIAIIENENKIWEITKKYDRNEFPSNSSSVGYAIDVYQESINKTFREYLVNYNYFTKVLEDYGFVLISKNEANELGLPNSIGMFNELYNMLNNEVTKDPNIANEYGQSLNMSFGEKKISFLNKYFVFKKIRDVNTEQLALTFMGKTKNEENILNKLNKESQDVVKNLEKSKPGKKLKKKLKLIS